MTEKFTFQKILNFLRTKMGIFIIIAVIAVAVTTGAIVFINLREEDFRSISVFEISGTAMITREEDTLNAYQGMQLTDGDTVSMQAGEYLRLLLDEDKYITLEPNTTIELLASGNEQDSNTKIHLTTGSITNELQSKLSSNSSYEVTTPATTMAVRGTIFRVSSNQNADGDYTVDIEVFEGSVGTKLILPDGTVLSDEVLIETEKCAKIESDEIKTEFVTENVPINYSELPSVIVNQLIEWKESGALSEEYITADELKNLFHQNKENAKEESRAELPQESVSIEPDSSEPIEKPKKVVPKVPSQEAPDVGIVVLPSKEDTSLVVTTPPTVETSPTLPAPTPPAPPSHSKESSKSESSKSESSGSGGSDATPEQSEPVLPPSIFTVTFISGSASSNSVFATQQVTPGQTAKQPLLTPSNSANWYLSGSSTPYSFSTPVSDNITLYSTP